MENLKLIANPQDPPLGALIVAELINSSKKGKIDVQLLKDWKNPTNIQLSDDKNVFADWETSVSRILSQHLAPELSGGADCVAKTQVDTWINFANGPLSNQQSHEKSLDYLNSTLSTKTYLVDKKLSLGDIYVFSKIHAIKIDEKYNHVARWYKQMLAIPAVQKYSSISSQQKSKKPEGKKQEKTATKQDSTGRKQEGLFIDLPGAKMGEVVVRFPPEASGYLHIGHAKAALLNQHYAQIYKGKLIMRFDDTNPAKENVEFEQAILEDLKLLDIKPDRFTHSSDYFDMMLESCEKLIKLGKAYADDTPAEIMRDQREKKEPSANRDNSVEKNLEMWQEMKIASEKGQQCCIRAKMFYDSLNGAMRDPTIYRCKPEPHPRTGTKYKVYPTYDFACPIVDSVEGVTLTLRTTEYLDRDDQFYWFIEALNLRRPEIWAYSRLNMTNTVLSKRKLTWFVNEGLVDGWDDPRFPTVRGIIRRGMTVEGLKQFIIAQGSSRSVVFMSWDKIWSFNRKVLDPITTRYTALNSHELVPVDVAGATAGFLTAQNHPKDPTKGTKQVKIGPKLLIERADAETLVEGQNATFINWGNILIEKINRTNGVITGVQGKLNLDDRDFKNTVKLTWLAAEEKETGDLVKCFAVYFDHIISKAILGKDEDFKDFIGKETRKEVEVTGEMELKRVKKGEIIQLQRKGFFRCDVPFVPASGFSGKDQPMVLFHIPDGHVTTPNTTATKETSKKSAKKESSTSVSSGSDISSKIAAQGEKVRQLKADKADKAKVTEEVQILLKLKAEFKEATGQDWKPGQASVAPPVSADDISSKIAAQGEKVRQLKADKADKAKVTEEVQVLLKLKTEYKEVTGQDWKPGQAPAAPKVSADDISSKIAAQGEKVRQLKADKADKVKIGEEVQVLLKLKTEFKEVTGQEWKPSAVVATPKPSTDDISSKIAAQGEKVRQLKADKADKAKVTEEVQLLLKLKAEFKEVTGQDWKPGKAPVAPTVSADDISSKIAAQGEKVRQLEAKVTEEVQVLLKLKTEYKEATGQDWKPAAQAPKESSAKVVEKKDKQMSSSGQSSSLPGDEISAKITDQGDKVRQLKAAKADKATVTEAVDILLKLKKEYKEKTGQEWKPPGAVDTKSKAPEKPTKKDKPTKQIEKKDDTTKTGTRLGLEAKKNDDLSTWYSQVITKGEMIEYYDVSGCYVLRPWSYSIWKKIRHFLDGEIEKLGVEDCYFPIFVSKSALEREKDHIADFAPEVAWVTKSGDSDLAEPIAIRPTSETVMYPAYAKWLKSHRDLPLKLNQWNNVVRWEFKDPQPFLRTREFLWQEGHSAFATKAEAEEEVLQILELYARVYEELLAIPVVRGKKSEKEKFAGGDYTTTVEAFVSASGRAIQGATSHHLGQNFSEMFDMQVEGVEEGSDKSYVYQNSWGLTTRTIGVMVMVHGDDKGLVLPPRVASVQAIIVPCGITASTTPEQRQKLMDECLKLEQELKKDNKLKVRGDYRDNYSPGWKFNHWELKGVPVRVELGFKDLEKNQVTFVRRDNGEKLTASRNNVLGSIHELLEKIQAAMFAKASAELGEHIKQTNNWTDFCQQLDKKNILLSPFCGEISCEDKIKADSTREKTEDGAPSMGAKSLCIPFEQPKVSIDKIKCVHPDCKNKAKFYTLFGRSY